MHLPSAGRRPSRKIGGFLAPLPAKYPNLRNLQSRYRIHNLESKIINLGMHLTQVTAIQV